MQNSVIVAAGVVAITLVYACSSSKRGITATTGATSAPATTPVP